MFQFNDKWFCENCFVAGAPGNGPCASCGWPGTAKPVYDALPAGTVLHNRYIIGRVLGRGGFGITYLAYDSHESRRVAVKEYLPDSLTQRHTGDTEVSVYPGEKEQAFLSGAERFYEEAKTVSRFNGNPNIISVYEFFKENNTAYFVMEFLEGCDLRTWYEQNNGLSYPDAVRILTCVTDALLIVHSMRILHRDISPDNIFLCDDGSVKLIDFGAAKQVVGAQTQSLSIILKPGYAPYEQYQRRSVQGPWTDIYALGATFYYMLTGHLIDDAMTRRDHEALDLSQIPVEIQPVLEKMLAVQPQDRYQTVIELKHALTAAHIDEESARFFTLPPVGSSKPSSAYYDDRYGDPAGPVQPAYSIPQPTQIQHNSPYSEGLDDPEEERRMKRRKTGLIIGIIAGLLLIAALLFILITGGRPKDRPDKGLTAVESITLSDTVLVMKVGDTVFLHASIYPADAVNNAVKWESSDTAVATVDENGIVTAVGAGTVTVTASAGGEVTAQCQITVETLGELTLSETRLELCVGETAELTTAYLGEVAWKSDSVEVATVDDNGVVTAVGNGTAIITASAGGDSASCAVTVTTGVESLTLSETDLELALGGTAELLLTIEPEAAADADVEWASSDENIVTVKRGMLTPVAPGRAEITVTAGGCTASCRVAVVAVLTDIRLDTGSLKMEIGETYTFGVTVKPDAVTNPTLHWSTSNAGVVSVQDGSVTAIAPGTATITVSSDDVKATCEVTVTVATVTAEAYTMSTPMGSLTGTYSGQWNNGKPSGEGTLTVTEAASMISGSSYTPGDKLSGPWVNGLLNGSGKIEYADGSVYTGDFSNGLRHGSGTLALPDGTSVSGKWANDWFLGD